MSDQRYEFYYSLQSEDGEVEDGKVFCTSEEADRIEAALRAGLPDWVEITVEGGGEYDFTTEGGATPESVAADILSMSGFISEEKE